MMKFKYVKNSALEFGHSSTFMPKPCSATTVRVHTHIPAVEERRAPVLRRAWRPCLDGLLVRLWPLALSTRPAPLPSMNPSNSFRRLRSRFRGPDQPRVLARNCSACIRIPVTGTSPSAAAEYRVPGPEREPLPGVLRVPQRVSTASSARIEPAAPIDKDLYELPPAEYQDIAKLPSSLELLDALREDHEFLTEGDVFTQTSSTRGWSTRSINEVALMRAYPASFHHQRSTTTCDISGPTPIKGRGPRHNQ